jgi:hypothetical protein
MRPLPTISVFNEAPHRFPAESRENRNSRAASHSQHQTQTSPGGDAMSERGYAQGRPFQPKSQIPERRRQFGQGCPAAPHKAMSLT